jgi:hypothetical protein
VQHPHSLICSTLTMASIVLCTPCATPSPQALTRTCCSHPRHRHEPNRRQAIPAAQIDEEPPTHVAAEMPVDLRPLELHAAQQAVGEQWHGGSRNRCSHAVRQGGRRWNESVYHLLLACVYSREVWFKVLRRCGWQGLAPSMDDCLIEWWLVELLICCLF